MNIQVQSKVKKRFDEMYKQGIKPWRDHPIEPLFYTFFKTVSHIYPQAKLLDIGCGDGWASILAAKKDFTAWGIDSSKTAINEAIEEANKENVSNRVHFSVGDALKLPYEDSFFDAIIDGGLFHHIIPENRELYLINILRVLKRNGLMYLTVFSKNTPSTVGYHFTKEEIEELFGKHFKIVNFEEDDQRSSFMTLHFILQRTNGAF